MASIIRENRNRETPSGQMVQPVSFSFSDFRGQADDYLDSVRQEAAKIVQQAHREADQIRRDAEANGRKAAEAAIERLLEEKVTRRLETLLPTLDQLVAQINDAKGALLAEWEKSALRVATAIAQRVIRREIDRTPDITLDLVAEALRLAAGNGEIVVRVNTEDYSLLRPQLERLGEAICHLAPAAVVPDPDVSRGGCRVDTRFGSVDQRIETQIARIEEELT